MTNALAWSIQIVITQMEYKTDFNILFSAEHRLIASNSTSNQLLQYVPPILKFVYSEKATKFCEISILLLSTVHTDRSKVEVLQKILASQNIWTLSILIARVGFKLSSFLFVFCWRKSKIVSVWEAGNILKFIQRFQYCPGQQIQPFLSCFFLT